MRVKNLNSSQSALNKQNEMSQIRDAFITFACGIIFSKKIWARG